MWYFCWVVEEECGLFGSCVGWNWKKGFFWGCCGLFEYWGWEV